MENHHKALDEIAQHARKVAEQIHQRGYRGSVLSFQRGLQQYGYYQFGVRS